MLARVTSCATQGIQGLFVEVEADLGAGLPTFSIVGLPDAAVRESRERVLAALRNCGFEFPARKITVNLAPAHVRKEGARFDLPIAVALLLASGQIPRGAPLEEGVFVGELALDGTLRGVRGILAVLAAAKREGRGPVWIPRENAGEARSIGGVSFQALGSLRELRGDEAPPSAAREEAPGLGGATPARLVLPDLSEVRGQALARRALEVAAAGGHNTLFVGPPGSGKTMLAKRLPGILPPLRREESVEVSTIHSVAGRLPPGTGLILDPPFRAPHHTISDAGLVGGGRGPVPGEVSLAHRGVLFLDELPEFHRNALEALRQPLEEGYVSIARVGGATVFPASFSLVAAMNPWRSVAILPTRAQRPENPRFPNTLPDTSPITRGTSPEASSRCRPAAAGSLPVARGQHGDLGQLGAGQGSTPRFSPPRHHRVCRVRPMPRQKVSLGRCQRGPATTGSHTACIRRSTWDRSEYRG